jgi:hypothetical protein
MRLVACFIVGLLTVGCVNKVMEANSNRPSVLVGSWIKVDSTDPSSESILILKTDGSYIYSISSRIDSINPKIICVDSGTWRVEPDTSSDEADNGDDFYTTGIGRNCFHSHVKLSMEDNKDVFTIYTDKETPLFVFHRKKG